MTKKPSILSKLGASLSADPALPEHPAGPQDHRPRVASIAIGGFGQSLKDLAADSIVTLDSDLIEPSPFLDRIEHDEDALNLLIASIEAEGQRLPVLVRPHPEKEGRYQLAYGHRRLLALRALDLKVRAFVRPLSDAELILEQGAENGGREALTWIERALFAEKMEAQGHPPKTVWATLGTDRSGLSRMRAVVGSIPPNLIRAIGRAPGIGQPRWQELAEAFRMDGATQRASSAIQAEGFASLSSDAKFLGVLRAVKDQSQKRPPAIDPREIKSDGGKKIGLVMTTAKGEVLTIPKSEAVFSSWLTAQLPDLYRTFLNSGAESG